MLHRKGFLNRLPSLRRLQSAARARPSPSPAVAAVNTIVYPGCRVVELSDFPNGNALNMDSLSQISLKLKQFEDNNAVSAVLFTAELNPELHEDNVFSLGFTQTPSEELVDRVQTLSKDIFLHQTITLTAYEGYTTGTAFGLFGGSKYRLGTCNSQLQLSELRQGLLPIGGTAYHFSKGCKEGVAFARYMGVTQRILESGEMFSLGLLSHCVPQECHSVLFHGLGHTLAEK